MWRFALMAILFTNQVYLLVQNLKTIRHKSPNSKITGYFTVTWNLQKLFQWQRKAEQSHPAEPWLRYTDLLDLALASGSNASYSWGSACEDMLKAEWLRFWIYQGMYYLIVPVTICESHHEIPQIQRITVDSIAAKNQSVLVFSQHFQGQEMALWGTRRIGLSTVNLSPWQLGGRFCLPFILPAATAGSYVPVWQVATAMGWCKGTINPSNDSHRMYQKMVGLFLQPTLKPWSTSKLSGDEHPS